MRSCPHLAAPASRRSGDAARSDVPRLRADESQVTLRQVGLRATTREGRDQARRKLAADLRLETLTGSGALRVLDWVRVPARPLERRDSGHAGPIGREDPPSDP